MPVNKREGSAAHENSGWTLPLSGNNKDIPALNNDSKSGSFYNLLAGYGLTGQVVTPDAGNYDVVMPDGTTKNQAFAKGEFNIAAAPLYFVRSGYTDHNHGQLIGTGKGNDTWSRTAATYESPTSARAYLIGLDNRIIHPTTGPDYLWYGFPLRCLAL